MLYPPSNRPDPILDASSDMPVREGRPGTEQSVGRLLFCLAMVELLEGACVKHVGEQRVMVLTGRVVGALLYGQPRRV